MKHIKVSSDLGRCTLAADSQRTGSQQTLSEKNPLQAVDWKICKFLTEYLGQKVLIVLTLWRLELIFGCQIKVLWWTLEAWTWEMSRTKSWRELHVS